MRAGALPARRCLRPCGCPVLRPSGAGSRHPPRAGCERSSRRAPRWAGIRAHGHGWHPCSMRCGSCIWGCLRDAALRGSRLPPAGPCGRVRPLRSPTRGTSLPTQPRACGRTAACHAPVGLLAPGSRASPALTRGRAHRAPGQPSRAPSPRGAGGSPQWPAFALRARLARRIQRRLRPGLSPGSLVHPHGYLTRPARSGTFQGASPRDPGRPQRRCLHPDYKRVPRGLHLVA